MSAFAAPTTRLPTDNEQDPAGGGLSLVALLDLVGAPTDPTPEPGRSTPARRVAGWPVSGLRQRLRGWVQRAVNWGAGPHGAWCAW